MDPNLSYALFSFPDLKGKNTDPGHLCAREFVVDLSSKRARAASPNDVAPQRYIILIFYGPILQCPAIFACSLQETAFACLLMVLPYVLFGVQGTSSSVPRVLIIDGFSGHLYVL